MTSDPTEIPSSTVRIPANALGINMIPAFGGGYIIRFSGPGGGLIGPEITAPVSVTFHPDGTLTLPMPLAAVNWEPKDDNAS